jgi:signal transduction histidine kinase
MSDEHRVTYADDGTRIRTRADPTALHEVLAHLVENAVKYSPGGTTIVLRSALSADGDAIIDIVDQGIGIPDDVDVFAAFQRGADRGTPGVGLGLYIVRNLVHAMGGTVDAHRNAVVGSTFTVRLPIA